MNILNPPVEAISILDSLIDKDELDCQINRVEDIIDILERVSYDRLKDVCSDPLVSYDLAYEMKMYREKLLNLYKSMYGKERERADE